VIESMRSRFSRVGRGGRGISCSFLEERIFEDLYTEIERMHPVFKFLLAPQTGRKNKEGMASLRQVVATVAIPQRKPQGELDTYANLLNEWPTTERKSAIRMLSIGRRDPCIYLVTTASISFHYPLTYGCISSVFITYPATLLRKHLLAYPTRVIFAA